MALKFIDWSHIKGSECKKNGISHALRVVKSHINGIKGKPGWSWAPGIYRWLCLVWQGEWHHLLKHSEAIPLSFQVILMRTYQTKLLRQYMLCECFDSLSWQCYSGSYRIAWSGAAASKSPLRAFEQRAPLALWGIVVCSSPYTIGLLYWIPWRLTAWRGFTCSSDANL